MGINAYLKEVWSEWEQKTGYPEEEGLMPRGRGIWVLARVERRQREQK